MEYWDIYDSARNKTDRTMVRGDGFREDAYHLVVHVCIFNKKGDCLIQQRQSTKEGWADYWDLTAGGAATKGDTSQKAAERELMEELGIEIDLTNIRPNLTVNFEKGFNDIYLVEKEVDLSKLSLQIEEVQDVRWASLDEIDQMIQSDEFIPYFPSFIHLLFESRRQYGLIREDREEKSNVALD